MRLLLTCDPGLEDVTEDEVRELRPGARVARRPHGVGGRVRVDVVGAFPLRRLGTVHHAVDVRGEAEVRSLDDVRRVVGELDLDELSRTASFRVSSRCDGGATLDRLEVQGAAGAVLVRRFGAAVDLEGFETNVRVDLHGARMVAGIQLTRESLGNRVRRGGLLRSSLRPTVAAAMLRLAGAHRRAGRLVDPMCGAGVIPVEAARLDAGLEISASDWDPETVETARATLRNHGLDLDVRLLDARSLGRLHAGTFDYLVTDPPYGLRQARRVRLSLLYRELLESFERAIVPSGRIVVIVVKHGTFRSALERTGLRAVADRVVDAGAIRPTIFTLERPA